MKETSKRIVVELYKKYGSITKLNKIRLLEYRKELIDKLESVKEDEYKK